MVDPGQGLPERPRLHRHTGSVRSAPAPGQEDGHGPHMVDHSSVGGQDSAALPPVLAAAMRWTARSGARDAGPQGVHS